MNRRRHVPYEGLTLAMGKQAGDYRRVGPECWDQLMRLYGGGPAIYVDGPPVEDLSRRVLFSFAFLLWVALADSFSPHFTRRPNAPGRRSAACLMLREHWCYASIQRWLT